MSRNILFISVDTIKERTGLHNNVDEKLINPEILAVQDMYILPALGTGLYNRLQDGIENNNLTNNENTLLDTYITPCLVYLAMSELPIGLSYQFYNKGLIRKTGDGQNEPSAQDIIDVANHYKTRAEFYKQRLILYLKQNATSSVFPEYFNPGAGVDTIQPELDGYTTTIYMGDDCGCMGKADLPIYIDPTRKCCNG